MKVLRNQCWGRAGFRTPRNELNVCVRPSGRRTAALQAGNGQTGLVLALTGCKPSGPKTREPVRHNVYGSSGYAPSWTPGYVYPAYVYPHRCGTCSGTSPWGVWQKAEPADEGRTKS